MDNPKSIHSSLSNKFRNLIIAARKEAGISQEILAERLSITQSSVSKIERGERRLDVVEFLYWCEAIGVRPEKIVQALAKAHRQD